MSVAGGLIARNRSRFDGFPEPLLDSYEASLRALEPRLHPLAAPELVAGRPRPDGHQPALLGIRRRVLQGRTADGGRHPLGHVRAARPRGRRPHRAVRAPGCLLPPQRTLDALAHRTEPPGAVGRLRPPPLQGQLEELLPRCSVLRRRPRALRDDPREPCGTARALPRRACAPLLRARFRLPHLRPGRAWPPGEFRPPALPHLRGGSWRRRAGPTRASTSTAEFRSSSVCTVPCASAI